MKDTTKKLVLDSLSEFTESIENNTGIKLQVQLRTSPHQTKIMSLKIEVDDKEFKDDGMSAYELNLKMIEKFWPDIEMLRKPFKLVCADSVEIIKCKLIGYSYCQNFTPYQLEMLTGKYMGRTIWVGEKLILNEIQKRKGFIHRLFKL